MKLIELEPEFIWYETRIEPRTVIVGDHETWRARGAPTQVVVGPVYYFNRVATLAEAQGIWFQCVKCYLKNKGPVGTHHVQVTFADRGVKDNEGCRNLEGKPTRWKVTGTGFHDLTTHPSILLLGGCNWHGFITNGEVN